MRHFLMRKNYAVWSHRKTFAATKACSKESNGLKAVMEGVVLISPISDLGINHLVTSTHVSSFFLHLEQQLAEEGIFDEGSFLPKLSKS